MNDILDLVLLNHISEKVNHVVPTHPAEYQTCHVTISHHPLSSWPVVDCSLPYPYRRILFVKFIDCFFLWARCLLEGLAFAIYEVTLFDFLTSFSCLMPNGSHFSLTSTGAVAWSSADIFGSPS